MIDKELYARAAKETERYFALTYWQEHGLSADMEYDEYVHMLKMAHVAYRLSELLLLCAEGHDPWPQHHEYLTDIAKSILASGKELGAGSREDHERSESYTH